LFALGCRARAALAEVRFHAVREWLQEVVEACGRAIGVRGSKQR
jgi:hypothetical protein